MFFVPRFTLWLCVLFSLKKRYTSKEWSLQNITLQGSSDGNRVTIFFDMFTADFWLDTFVYFIRLLTHVSWKKRSHVNCWLHTVRSFHLFLQHEPVPLNVIGGTFNELKTSLDYLFKLQVNIVMKLLETGYKMFRVHVNPTPGNIQEKVCILLEPGRRIISFIFGAEVKSL